MSNLSKIMYARGLTPNDLATLTGLTYPTIWRLLKNDCYETAQKSTQQKIAAALGVSVRDIIYGKEAQAVTEKEKAEVKRKIVETEVIKATEHLLLTLRNYYPEPMHLHISIFTKDSADTDYYDARVTSGDDTEEVLVDKSALVSVKDGKIADTVPYYKRGKQNE